MVDEKTTKRSILRGVSIMISIFILLALFIAVLWYQGSDDIANDPDNIYGPNHNDTEALARFKIIESLEDDVFTVSENLTFDGTDSEPLFCTYYWDFGDRVVNNDNKSIVVHSYTEEGVYYPTLTVTYGGISNTSQKRIEVNAERPPEIEIRILPSLEEQTNVLCRAVFNIQNFSSLEQLELENYNLIVFETNITGYYEKFNHSLASLKTPSINRSNVIEIEYIDGVNFTDNIPLDHLSSDLDELLIAGDGGGYEISIGDQIKLYYNPQNVVLDIIQIP